MNLPTSENEGWKTVSEGEQVVQVRKVGEGLFMMRQGADGTAIAITEQQLSAYLERLTRSRQN